MVERLNPFKVCPDCRNIASWDAYKQDYACPKCEISRKAFEPSLHIGRLTPWKDKTQWNISRP